MAYLAIMAKIERLALLAGSRIPRRADSARDEADANEREPETPHVQPKPSRSANSLRRKQRKTKAGHDCAEHVAPRGRRSSFDRARPLKAPEHHNKRNECDRIGCEPGEPRPPPWSASWLEPQADAAGEIRGEDNKDGGRHVPDEQRHDAAIHRHGRRPREAASEPAAHGSLRSKQQP